MLPYTYGIASGLLGLGVGSIGIISEGVTEAIVVELILGIVVDTVGVFVEVVTTEVVIGCTVVVQLSSGSK